MSTDTLSTPPTPVTVIMPVRNEGPYIDVSLGSVLRQSCGLEAMEILVVDGMSDDDTRERIERLQRQHPEAHIQVLDNPGRIAPCALNVGIRHATGDIIVRVDGHCEVGPHYVAHAVQHLENGADGVGGPLDTIGDGATAQAIAAAMSSRFGVGGVAFRTTETGSDMAPALDLEAIREVDTVAFPAYKRTAMDKVGLYNEEFVRNQDDEYNYRLRKSGARIVLALDMPARYYSRATYRKLWRQYFQYGFWKVRVLQEHPRQMSARQFVPPLFVLSLSITLASAAVIPPWGGLLFGAVTASYGAANLLASWTVGRDLGLGIARRLPLCFALVHLGYGSGFLVGLVRFAGRWLSKSKPPTPEPHVPPAP